MSNVQPADDSSFKRSLYWLPALLYGSLIVYLSSQSSPPGSILLVTFSDLVLHFIEFGGLGLTLMWGATRAGRERLTIRNLVILVAAASLFAAVDEWHQSFTPGRFPAVSDWMADTVGAAVFMTATHLCQAFWWVLRKEST